MGTGPCFLQEMRTLMAAHLSVALSDYLASPGLWFLIYCRKGASTGLLELWKV